MTSGSIYADTTQLDPSGFAIWPREYVRSALLARRRPPLKDVQRFCFFIGYARSGHSLVGSLLNAHPRMVIAHELDALRYVRMGFSRSQIYALLLEQDERFAAIGRTWSGYDYTVPGAPPGRPRARHRHR